MMNVWGTGGETIKADNNGKKQNNEKGSMEGGGKETGTNVIDANMNKSKNTILKGSKVTGDITVTCDLELHGDVEGNISSAKNSTIAIKGTCKGNIEAREGSIDIEGELKSGNIIAGSNVKITGKFSGGEIKAQGKIYVNGEFNGKLEGNEIDIGPGAQGKGELLYREYISISRGSNVEAQISRIQGEPKAGKDSSENKLVDIKPPAKETGEAQ